jgi:hypothetical protein
VVVERAVTLLRGKWRWLTAGRITTVRKVMNPGREPHEQAAANCHRLYLLLQTDSKDRQSVTDTTLDNTVSFEK